MKKVTREKGCDYLFKYMPAEPELFWDATYAIAITLLDSFPAIRPENMGIWELADLVENLPSFMDDPALATERMLLDIQTTWYEEKNT